MERLWPAVACAACCLSACCLSASGRTPEPSGERAKPTLLASYYVWYRTGDHPRFPWSNWTRKEAEASPAAQGARRPGEPPLSSSAYPLVGLYDSADPEVAAWHIELAKAAGIDAFLVSWWDRHKGRDEAFEKGVLAMAEKHDFKVALLDERAQFHRDLGEYKEMAVRNLLRYKRSPAYLHIDGRPVVYLYQVAGRASLTPEKFVELRRHVEARVGPVYWIVDKLAHDHRAQRAGEPDRAKCIPPEWLGVTGIDAFGFYSTFSHFRAHEYEDLAGKFRYLVETAHRAGKKMLLPVHPGHDNSRFGANPYVMPRRDGRTFRDYLRAAEDAGADFVMVTSWNEWPETTVVEPSSTWEDPYLYLKILAEWRGIEFVAPPEPERSTHEGQVPSSGSYRSWAGPDGEARPRRPAPLPAPATFGPGRQIRGTLEARPRKGYNHGGMGAASRARSLPGTVRSSRGDPTFARGREP